MARLQLSPLLTLVLGYILGCAFFPVSQLWMNYCFPDGYAVNSNAHAQLLDERSSAPRQIDNLESKQKLQHSWRRLANMYRGIAGRGPPAHLSSEFTVRGRIFIGVITAQKYLATRAKAIHETWAKDVGPASRVVFYVGEDCDTSAPALSDMTIVKLENVSDGEYPPQRKVFAALQHMYRYHGNSYHWFVRADDDVYIRVPRLDTLLGRLDSNEKIYLGRAGVGKKKDVRRLQLMSSERYCMGGPGVVLSRATLSAVAPHLGRCLEAVEDHNRAEGGVGVSGGAWFNEDVELGRCISRTIGIQCSHSREVCTCIYVMDGAA